MVGILQGWIKSRPARGGWIEIDFGKLIDLEWLESRPARGGWIEIRGTYAKYHAWGVPPRTGRVD